MLDTTDSVILFQFNEVRAPLRQSGSPPPSGLAQCTGLVLPPLLHLPGIVIFLRKLSHTSNQGLTFLSSAFFALPYSFSFLIRRMIALTKIRAKSQVLGQY